MSWFSRKPAQMDMLKTLLEIECKRTEMRGNLELRRMELEAENIEQRTKADLEVREWKAKQRERARALGLKNAATRKRNARGQFPRRGEETDCGLCEDPLRKDVTIAMITRHREHDGVGGGAMPTVDQPSAPTEVGN